MSAPLCTSKLGHWFEPRYSSRPSGQGIKLDGASGDVAVRLVEASLIRTYELDICVRCGAIVRKDDK